MWEGASAQALAPGGQLVTITGDTQGAFGIMELLTRGYQLVSRKLYCWFAIGGGASYHQVEAIKTPTHIQLTQPTLLNQTI